MTIAALLALGITLACLIILVTTRAAPDLVLVGGLTALLATGVLTPREALIGFSNPGVITVGVLYVLAAGLRETGALSGVVSRLFGRPDSVPVAQLRMMLPVTFLSGFLNNTPVVAAFLPAVMDWAKKLGIPAGKLMMPLSFAAIFGGTCTLMGTSTNLVVHGLLLEEGRDGFGFFELAWVGIPAAVVGLAYVLFASRWLLPDRRTSMESLSDPREYTVEMIVEGGSPLVGQTIEQAGLRHLPGLFLVEIDRDGRVIAAVNPEEELEAGDRLVFAGITESVVDLQRVQGLLPATEQLFKLDAPRSERSLVEVVISRNSPMAGKTVRQGRFRSTYNAVVIAVARDGRRIERKIGDIELHPGDTLLVEADVDFAQRYTNTRDFLLVRPIDSEGVVVPRHERRGIAWVILALVVGTITAGVLDILPAAMLGAGAMVLTRCCSASVARRSVDLEVLLVIAAAFGIGEALQKTGAAELLAGGGLSWAAEHPVLLLASVYAITVVLTSVITNNAAAVLMFPMVLVTVQAAGFELMPYAVTLTLAASAGFATPIAYQTNLMVYGPGGYRFSDYLRFGLPLNLLLGLATVILVPAIWPLEAGL